MRTRHRYIADKNLTHYFSLMDIGTRSASKPQPLGYCGDDGANRRSRYREYLTDEINHRFGEWQKEDWNNLRDLLVLVVKGDRRLHGYYEIGDHLGEAREMVKRDSGPLSKKDRAYILAGIKKLPLRQQREIEPFFTSDSLGLFVLAKRIQKLGRFLRSQENDLVATPKWDGRTITYRGESEEVRIQDKSVMTTILDEGEKQGWPDAIRLSSRLIGNKLSVANAIHYFQREHKLLEFSVNGDRVLWGAPGTLKRRGTTRRTRSV